MREFNIAASCVPSMHYMVDISGKIKEIRKIVDAGKYFTINRARQYGKTTVRYALEKELENEYIVINISFEGIGDTIFKEEETFSKELFSMFADSYLYTDESIAEKIRDFGKGVRNLKELGKAIALMTKNIGKKVVLIIDEVDKSSNNQLFISFLAMLRDKYILRNNKKDSTFHSIILIGVHDVKNLKAKLRPEDEKKYNSPWNVAVDFKVDMSFNPREIATMLVDYRTENDVEMDIEALSAEIYSYTSGYPFLVSKLCKLMDEELEQDFTSEGLQEAMKLIIKEKNTLFDDLIKNIEHNKEIYDTVFDLVVEGKEKVYNVDAHDKGIMYGIYRENERGKLSIHNKIFEIRIYNYMIAKQEEKKGELLSYHYRTNFIDEKGDLKIDTVLEKFQLLMKQEYREKDTKFIEREGRLLFLCFVRPIINSVGFYYVEPETRQDNRMDVVITYNRKQYIIELKIWHGEKKDIEGHLQLARYLDVQNESTGYMVVYDFNKNKEYTREWLEVNGKRIYEVIV